MRFSDAVTILRASTADEYGNPGASWTTPSELPASAFIAGSGKAMFPPVTDLQAGDRLRWQGVTYAIDDLKAVRSPNRTILLTAKLRRLEG